MVPSMNTAASLTKETMLFEQCARIEEAVILKFGNIFLLKRK